ncbi:uncharacterized protein LOC117218272 [Megalopta genalis]|uniref:uncharacterized protein LOC117218272 n=1 Tax=Megalopta genalis TaxID=115081 RepID=UPI003FD176BB
MALKRFNALQRRFKRNLAFKDQYSQVMQGYLDLGHMSENTDSTEDNGFFLPYHALMKETSMTTKLRVVFDGSAKTDTGISLNEVLMFLIRKEDQPFQRVMWTNPAGEVKTFKLNTVTFGLSPAPFLATRCLQQLAKDEGHRYKHAGQILRRDLYVDELLTRAATVEDAIRVLDEIIDLLHHAGLNFRQWASDSPTLLQVLPEGSVKLQAHDDKALKTLGVAWNFPQDSIVYSVHPITIDARITKRTILSTIAKIFDPLGLLGPAIITAKLIMQRLWQLKLDWDVNPYPSSSTLPGSIIAHNSTY